MKQYRIGITKVCYGYVVVKAENKAEAIQKTKDMDIEEEYTHNEEVTEIGKIEIIDDNVE